MKVRDLIQCLQEMDPDMEVMASDNHAEGRPGAVFTNGVAEGSSFFEVLASEEAGDDEPFCMVWLGPAPPEES